MVCYVVEKNLVDDNESPTLYYNITRRKKISGYIKRSKLTPPLYLLLLFLIIKGWGREGYMYVLVLYQSFVVEFTM